MNLKMAIRTYRFVNDAKNNLNVCNMYVQQRYYMV